MLPLINEIEKRPKSSTSAARVFFYVAMVGVGGFAFHDKILTDLDQRFFTRAEGKEMDRRMDNVEMKIDRRLEIIEYDIKTLLKEVK